MQERCTIFEKTKKCFHSYATLPHTQHRFFHSISLTTHSVERELGASKAKLGVKANTRREHAKGEEAEWFEKECADEARG